MKDTMVWQGGEWLRTSPSLLAEMAFFGSVAWKGSVYAVGDRVDVLKPGAKAWRNLVPAGKLPATHLAVARMGGRAYVLGGYPADRGAFRSFDLDTGDVRAEPGLPEFSPGDHFFILVALMGKLHAIGGLSSPDFRETKRHYVFDGISWKAALQPPQPLWAKFSAIASDGQRVWVLGSKTALEYDSARQDWRLVTPMPRELAMPTTAVIDGNVVVLGGLSKDPRERIRWSFDPVRNTWSTN